MNDIPGGVCDYCNADEGRCWDDCPTVKIEQQAKEIERLREAFKTLADDIESNLYDDPRTEADKAYNLGIRQSTELARSALQQKESE